MNKASKRFASLKRLADWKEKGAAAQFGNRRRVRDDAHKRLQELHLYHHEYLQRYQGAVHQGGDIRRAHDYQLFLDKLECAIAEQQRIVEQQTRLCEQAKLEWNDRYIDSRSMQNVIERRLEEERRQQAKAEQRQLDDRCPRKD